MAAWSCYTEGMEFEHDQRRPAGTALDTHLRRVWRRVWPILRQVLGWMFIVLGILGIVLPILHGVLFLMIGIALVGRRNVVIRWSSVRFKQLVRRWAALETPLVGAAGRLALRAQQESSRQRRRMVWRYAAWKQNRQAKERRLP